MAQTLEEHSLKRIPIPVGFIIHLKVLRFELDDRNECYSLPDAAILAAIDISQLFVMRITCNEDSRDVERHK